MARNAHIDTRKVGAGLAAAAAAAAGAAAGYYFYASKNAKQHRRVAAKWASDMRRDVVKQAKNMQKMDRKQVLKLVDGAAATYETVRGIDRSDLRKAAQELKDNWALVAREASGTARTSLKRVKSAAKKSVRKTTRTISKKRR